MTSLLDGVNLPVLPFAEINHGRRNLEDIQDGMIELVGGKALGLGMMIRAGVHVPDGFCVTTRIHSLGKISQGCRS
jgi:hypothetical protein